MKHLVSKALLENRVCAMTVAQLCMYAQTYAAETPG